MSCEVSFDPSLGPRRIRHVVEVRGFRKMNDQGVAGLIFG